jgi:ubiquinone/menaquinone biosynthesis C-methylase UbiE
VTARILLEQADVKAGDVVLDAGCGLGDPGLSAARLVGPGGQVTCLDISGDMLAFAERRARADGLANVRFIQDDLEAPTFEPARYDVVLSRATLMYASDPLQALRHLRAALRPGGRLAVAVWATPERVAFATPIVVMAELLDMGPPPTGPGPFALGAPGVLEALVHQAGFTDTAGGTAVSVFEFESAEVCTQWLRDVAPPITDLVANQPASVQHQVWEMVTEAWRTFEGDDGHVRLPCTAVWASGRNPGGA